MAGKFPEAWQETCFVTIQEKGQSAQQFAAITETIDINEGDYPGESVSTTAGGRIWKQSSAEDGEITLEIYPIKLDYAAGGVISSINGDGTDIILSTATAHGLAIGDTVRVSNTTNYGTTSTPVNYVVDSVTDSDTVVMKSSTSEAEETDGTWVGYKGNTGLFQQYVGHLLPTAISSINGDADSVDITSTAHGLQEGDVFEVSGTTNYNGPYVVTTRTDANNIVCTDEGHNEAEETAGFLTKVSDGSQPLSTDITQLASTAKLRDRFIIAILWTQDIAVDSAMDATRDTDKTAIRFYAKECRITSHKASFTDGILKVTLTLKFPYMNKAGTTKSSAWESTDDTDTKVLPALTYT